MRPIDADAFKEYICNAYEQVKHMYPDGGKWARQITEDFCKDIDEQPTIEPQKWISCDERLPEDYIRVLTTNSKIGAWEVDINSRNVAGWIYSSDPVAWMPLPDPWKEEEE